MQQGTDFLRERLDNTLFALRIYEMYNKKTPADNLAAEMCNRYRERIDMLTEELCLDE